MIIVRADRIDEFGQRWYSDEGGDEPSVTTYLEVAPKGKAFETFLMTVKNPEEVRDEAGQLGSSVHSLIEKTLKKKRVFYEEINDKEPVEVWKRYLFWCVWFKQFISTHDVKWEEADVERIIIDHELHLGGTLDWTPVVDRRNSVVDWKTGRSIWDTAYIQVSTYAKAYSKILGEPVTNALIVQLGEDLNKKGWREYPVENIDTDFEFFQMYQKIWRRKNKNEKPLFRTYPKEMDLNTIYNQKDIIGGRL